MVDGFVEKARDLYVAQRVMGLHGVFPEALGEMFLCPVPGHDETTFDPSAVLWQCEKGYIVMQCFHDKQTWTLPELYFAYKRGEFRELAPGVEAVWWLRSLDDLGITPLPKQPTVLLPEDAPKFTQEIYDGFVYLERLRDRARPDQRGHPYSWEFALDWCGLDLSESSMRRRMGYLLKHRYLRVTKKAGARSSEETTLTLFRTRQ